jgi:hypothetical protein
LQYEERRQAKSDHWVEEPGYNSKNVHDLKNDGRFSEEEDIADRKIERNYEMNEASSAEEI